MNAQHTRTSSICNMDQVGIYSMNSLISCTLHQYNSLNFARTQFIIQEFVFTKKVTKAVLTHNCFLQRR